MASSLESEPARSEVEVVFHPMSALACAALARPRDEHDIGTAAEFDAMLSAAGGHVRVDLSTCRDCVNTLYVYETSERVLTLRNDPGRGGPA
jgi:hypothetical protein